MLSLGVYLLIRHFFLSKIKVGVIKKNQFYALVFHLILLAYGLFLSSVNGGFVLIESRDLVFTFLSLFLTLALILEFNRNSIFFNSSVIDAPPSNFDARQINLNSLLILLLIISPFLLYVFQAIELLQFPE